MERPLGEDTGISVAHYFIPLEEPLAFPDGLTQRLEVPATIDDVIDAGEAETSIRIGDPVDWVSLKFWHHDDTTPSGTIDSLFEVARRAIPSLPPPTGKVDRPPTPVTIVECVAPVRRDLDPEHALSESFDKCLDGIRLLQRAYRMATGLPVTLCAREQMPVMLPFAWRRNVTEEAPDWPEGLEIFMPHSNLHRLGRYPDLDSTGLEAVWHALDVIDSDRIFSRYADLRQQVWHLCTRQGEYESSVVLAGTATETLLDDLLMSLVWEDRMPPERASRLFDTGLEARIKSLYGPRIGGSWQLDRPGTIQRWRKDIAALRHRVVHAGWSVGHVDALNAANAMEDIFAFVSDRLARPENVRRWPRTCLALLGMSRLDELRLVTRRLRDLAADPDEPDWAATFRRYRVAVAQGRRDAAQLFEPPDSTRSVVVALVQSDGAVSWWLHDRVARQVRRCSVPDLNPQQQAALDDGRREAAAQDIQEPASLAFFGASASPAEHSDWLPQYKVLALEGVMVDRSDLDELPRLLDKQS